ncbi:MAG: hypothetical protein N2Z85_02060 [Patescibacteria group bacterium]|nr:hypothetical protein [Patescibacteria group bacterium]
MAKVKKELIKDILKEKGLTDDEIKERLNEKYTDEELARKNKPQVGFKAIEVSSGNYRVIDKFGRFISPEMERNEAFKLANDMNSKDPEVKLKIVSGVPNIWFEM